MGSEAVEWAPTDATRSPGPLPRVQTCARSIRRGGYDGDQDARKDFGSLAGFEDGGGAVVDQDSGCHGGVERRSDRVVTDAAREGSASGREQQARRLPG